jgi:hypothetical protein
MNPALRISCSALVALILAGWAAVTAETAISLGDFEAYQEDWVLGLGPEFPGAQGATAIDTTPPPKQGKGALRLDVDFSKGGGYIQIGRRFPDGLPLRTLNGWLHSEGVSAIRFRATDSSGQTFQSRHFPVQQGKGWFRLSLGMEELCRDEHWEGKNDGAWHGPLKNLSIMVSSSGADAATHQGSLWFDGLSAVLEAGAAAPEAMPAAKMIELDGGEHGTPGWKFTDGSEFPGAKGGLTTGTEAKVGKRSIRMDADFTGGGSYVASTLDLADRNLDIREVRVWVKRDNVDALGIRLIDGGGQCHQGAAKALKPIDGWQEVVFQVPAIVGGEHWGGANDGAWHPPLKAISFAIGNPNVGPGKKASIWLDDLRGAVLAESKGRKK